MSHDVIGTPAFQTQRLTGTTPALLKGNLSIEGDVLRFKNSGKPSVQGEIASIHDMFLGDVSKQVGGIPMTLGKAAIPFSGGRAVSLITRKMSLYDNHDVHS